MKFWLDIPKDNVIWLVNIVRDVGKHCEDNPVESIYDLFFKNKENDDTIKCIWDQLQKEWIIKALESEDISTGSNLIRKFRTKYCVEGDNICDLPELMFIHMYELYHKDANISVGEISTENFLKSSNTVSNSIDSLLTTLDVMGNNVNVEEKNMLTTIKRSVQDIKDKNAYFVETWKDVIDIANGRKKWQ